MTLSDFIFLALIFGLPIVVSVRLFQSASNRRPFLATWALAVIGSSMLFVLASFLLMITGIGGLGPLDGIFEVIVSVPVALIAGVIIRRRRNSVTL